MYRAVLLLALFLLGACSQTSNFVRPALPVPQNWPSAGPEDSKSLVPTTHWRAFFSDPRLQALIETALENNRDLRIAVGRVEEARAQYGIVRADRVPSVNLLGSGSATRTPGDLSGTGVASTSQRYDLTLSTVSFELDFWGRIAGLTEAARVGYLATEEARRAVHLSLVADVASSYFTLLQMNELAALARSTVDLRQQSLVLIEKGRDLGGTYDLEVQQASGILEASRASLDGIEHQRRAAINRIHFLVGYADMVLPTEGFFDGGSIGEDLAPGLPADVLLVRPDVMAAEQRLIAAHANVGAARAAFLPKIVLTAAMGAASQGLAGLFSGGAWSFQPTMSMPLFDGGRLGSSMDIARAREVIGVAEYEKTIQQAFREVADLLSSRSALSSQLKASRASLGAQELRFRIVQARYKAGLVSYLDVLEGQRELIAAQEMGIQVRRAQLESSAQLFKALGGGGQYE